MTKKTKITPQSVTRFADLLLRWSTCNDSYFIREFWESFAMTEMQFYKRLWAAQKFVGSFDYLDVKKNLKINRILRHKKREHYGKGKTIRIDFQKQEGDSEKSGQYEEEGGG